MNRIIARLACIAALLAATAGAAAQTPPQNPPQAPAQTGEKGGAEALFAHLRPGDKAAVVAVHYGSSAQTALATLDRFNLRLAAAFPGTDFRQAWAAGIVIRKHNAQVDALTEPATDEEDNEFCLRRHKVEGVERLLDELWRDGYTHVLIQPSFVIEGVEMNVLRQQVAQVESHFAEVRIGQPLLTSPQDYRNVLEALAKAVPAGRPVVLAAHGSGYDACNGAYALLDYIMHEDGKTYTRWYTATVSGFPTLAHALAQARADKVKKATIVPLLFACGVHAREDLASAWVDTLRQNGISATLYNHALGDNDDILDLYTAHARQAEQRRIPTPMEMKQAYSGQ